MRFDLGLTAVMVIVFHNIWTGFVFRVQSKVTDGAVLYSMFDIFFNVELT